MKDQDKAREERTPFAGTNLFREVSYLHADEAAALAKRAEQKWVSKSEVTRAYLGFEG